MIAPSLRAFCNELEKLAAPVITDEDELKKKLKPGDILYTTARETSGVFNKLFMGLNRWVQGSPYTHVGMYAGDGKVIDSGDWTKRPGGHLGVNQVPLDDFQDRYKFKVLRVRTSPAEKKKAVSYAQDQVGKPFNLGGMLRLVLPFKSSVEGDRERKDAAESFFCSELVANAYGGLGIAKQKHFHHVMPGDIAKSSLTKTVAEYE